MSYLLEHLDLIEKALRRSPFGFITDIDGTISKTAPTPQEAEVSPLCRHYLSILVKRLALVAAISGRPAAEVQNMVAVDGMVYIGNHGLEHLDEGGLKLIRDVKDYVRIIKATIDELMPSLTMPGIIVENKAVTATIHYRLCANRQAAKRKILATLKTSTQAKHLQIMPGKMSINLRPPVAINKGTAVLKLVQEYNLQAGVYLGDEITDMDAFKAIHAASRDSNFQGFAISITSREMPKRLLAESDFTLNGINDVERFLGWLSRTAPQAG